MTENGGNITIDDITYKIEELPTKARQLISFISYLDNRETEVGQLFQSLRVAKHTYIEKIKSRSIADKAGLFL